MTRIALLLVGLTASAPLAFAAGDAPSADFAIVEGQHYKLLDPPVPTSVAPGKVEVIEFFSLGCPHCAEFEPYLEDWLKKKPANVVFTRIPASFNPTFKLLARAYYALEDAGAAERLSPLLFTAIHTDRDPDLVRPIGEYQRQAQVNDVQAAAAAGRDFSLALAAWAKRHGADDKKFLLAWNSPSVSTKLARAEATFRRYGVMGVPSLAVDGKYFTSAGAPFAARSFPELAAVLRYLAAREAKLVH